MQIQIDFTTDELNEVLRIVTMSGKLGLLEDISDTLQHIEGVNRQMLREDRRVARATTRLARNVIGPLEEVDADEEATILQEYDDGR